MNTQEHEEAKRSCIYESPVTGMIYDSGTWLYDMDEQEWNDYKAGKKSVKD